MTALLIAGLVIGLLTGYTLGLRRRDWVQWIVVLGVSLGFSMLFGLALAP